MSEAPAPTYSPARLRELVAGSDLSQREVATRAGIGQAHLYRIVSGATTPRADLVAKILAAVGRDWADLD